MPKPKGLSRQDREQTPAGGTGRQVHWAEELITQAQARGDFDNLPGRGRPLHLDETDPYAGDDAEAYRLLKNAGFTPEWIDLRREIAAAVIWLREHPGHPERQSRIVEVNVKIDRHNRLIPAANLAFVRVPRDFAADSK